MYINKREIHSLFIIWKFAVLKPLRLTKSAIYGLTLILFDDLLVLFIDLIV